MDYRYNAQITRIVDGDTFDAKIDLGFKIFVKMRFRTYGINTPETYGVKKDSLEYQEGLKAKNWLSNRVLNKWVTLNTFKDKKGKYGRYIASITLDGKDIGQEMLSEGLAKPY